MSVRRFNVIKYGAHPTPEGSYVLYADHLAAYEDVKKRAYLHALDRARDAVAALLVEETVFGINVVSTEQVMSAIDALRGTDA